MSNMELPTMDQKEPYQNCVKIKHNNFYYVLTENEFVQHVLPNMPRVLKMAGLKRGKYYARWLKEMNRKGSGKHAEN